MNGIPCSRQHFCRLLKLILLITQTCRVGVCKGRAFVPRRYFCGTLTQSAKAPEKQMRARAAGAAAEVITGDGALSTVPSAGGSTPPTRDGRISFLMSISAAHGVLTYLHPTTDMLQQWVRRCLQIWRANSSKMSRNNCGTLSLSNMEFDPTFCL